MKFSKFVFLGLVTLLLAVSVMPVGQAQATVGDTPLSTVADSAQQGNASVATGSAGRNVSAQYSSQVPVLSAQQQSSMQALQAASNRTGDMVPSAVPAAGAQLGPEAKAPSTQAVSSDLGATAFAAGAFAVFRNTAINGGASGGTSPYRSNYTMEPSTGVGGMRIFQTGNWYAARSLNGGSTWGYLNPYTIFTDTTVTGFCCDQVTLYDASRDTEFWLLQYSNGLKLGLSRDAFTNWCYYNITPGTVGEPSTTELDYNDLAIGARYVYIATNFFRADGSGGSFILRMPIDSLLTCGGWSGGYVKRTTDFTFKPVQGASDVMYWASNWNELARGSSMRLFAWAENSGSYSWWDKTGLPAWAFEYRHNGQNCGSIGGTTVKNWCDYGDSRVLGGALINGRPSPELVFSFNTKQDANHAFPYTRIFRFRESDKAYLGQAEIWASWAAFQYAALSPNARGDLAMNVAWGGQSSGGVVHYPSAGVLIQDDYSPSQPWQRYDYVVGSGNTCTYGGIYRWGDYLTVRPYYPAGFTWIAVGYAIKGANCGATGWYSQFHNVAFGRGRDQNSYYRWYNK